MFFCGIFNKLLPVFTSCSRKQKFPHQPLFIFREKVQDIPILGPALPYPHPILPPATYLNSCPLSYPPYHILNPARILTPAPILTPTLIIDPSHIPPLPLSYPPQLILTPPPILTLPLSYPMPPILTPIPYPNPCPVQPLHPIKLFGCHAIGIHIRVCQEQHKYYSSASP